MKNLQITKLSQEQLQKITGGQGTPYPILVGLDDLFKKLG